MTLEPLDTTRTPPPPHPVSLAVWDAPFPATVDAPATVKVGVQCAMGCRLSGQVVHVADLDGRVAGTATLETSPLAGTEGLYWAEVTFEAPAVPGLASRVALFVPENTHETAHCETSAVFTFRTDPPGEHLVTIRVVHRTTTEPVGGAEVRVGLYAAATDSGGEARFHVPAGAYDCTVRKSGLEFDPVGLDVTQDLDVCIEAAEGLTREEFDARLSRYEDYPWG